MNSHPGWRRKEKGVALLMALFALILISAVGVAIVFMSTGETSIVSNERANSGAWEAAKAGLQEMRARLSGGDFNSFQGTHLPLAAGSLPLDSQHVIYILNPAGASDPVKPLDPANPYFDWEYKQEWGLDVSNPGYTVTTVGHTTTVKDSGGTIVLTVYTTDSEMQHFLSAVDPIPAYKWVRLTVKTESSANEDIAAPTPDGCFVPTPPAACGYPLVYDLSTNTQERPAAPPTSTLSMVYRITSFAVLPSGTSRMLQVDAYNTNPIPSSSSSPTMPAALTICGPDDVSWPAAPTGSGFLFNGTDASSPTTLLDAIGICGPTARGKISSHLAGGTPGGGDVATGLSAAPDVVDITPFLTGPDSCLSSTSCLNRLVVAILHEAVSDGIYSPTTAKVYNPSDAPGPTATGDLGNIASPKIVMVTDSPPFIGNLHLNDCSGAGILVVTGTLECDGGTYQGIVLVIGQGRVILSGSPIFQGEFFVARINTLAGVLSPTFLRPIFITAPAFPATTPLPAVAPGYIQYDSAQVARMENLFDWQILSAREINQNQ